MTVGALVARTALIIVTFTGIALAQLSHRPPPGPFDRCEMQGRGADPALNAQMNRIERVEVGETFTVARMELLPAVPARDGALRENWPSAVSTHIAWLEKHGVSFAGYIVRAEMENPGPRTAGAKRFVIATFASTLPIGLGNRLPTQRSRRLRRASAP
jgi:hypothetical protein